MSNVAWNDEQADEALQRFISLTPKLQADARFCCGVYLYEGNYFPFVYLKAEEPEEDTEDMSAYRRHIYIVKQEEGFHLRMRDMFILIGAGIPTQWLPSQTLEEELDEKILWIWENWFRLHPESNALPL